MMQTAIARPAAAQQCQTLRAADEFAPELSEDGFRAFLGERDVTWAGNASASDGQSSRAEEQESSADDPTRERPSDGAASVVVLPNPVDTCALSVEAGESAGDAASPRVRLAGRVLLPLAGATEGDAVEAAEMKHGEEVRETGQTAQISVRRSGQKNAAQDSGADDPSDDGIAVRRIEIPLTEEAVPPQQVTEVSDDASYGPSLPNDELEFLRLAETLNLLPACGAPVDDAVATPVAARFNEARFLESVLRQSRLLSHPDGASEMRLRLDPPELGSVELRLCLRGDRLQAVVRVEDPDTVSRIQELVPRMRVLFAAEGISVDRLSVELRLPSDAGAHMPLRRERGPEARAIFRGPDGAPARRSAALCVQPVGAMDFLA